MSSSLSSLSLCFHFCLFCVSSFSLSFISLYLYLCLLSLYVFIFVLSFRMKICFRSLSSCLFSLETFFGFEVRKVFAFHLFHFPSDCLDCIDFFISLFSSISLLTNLNSCLFVCLYVLVCPKNVFKLKSNFKAFSLLDQH